MEVYNQNGCVVSGKVVIDSVAHLVEEKFVKCDNSLNRRAWNTTEEVSMCPVCFPDGKVKGITGKQLDLFFDN